MVLQVNYKDGTRRRVNLTEHFFVPGEVSISKKAQDFAFMHGIQPYYIGLFKGDKAVYENTIRANQPDEKVETKRVDESEIKKDFRKEFKNKPLRKISFDQLNDMSKWA